MKKIFFVPAFIFILIIQPVWVMAEPAFARISTLIEKANDYDGRTIVLKGEAVGDLMHRATGTWLNISDDSAAIGIFFEKGAIPPPRLNFLGDYFYHGDQVEVTGVFHKACRFHEGELDIHAQAVKVLAPGHPINHPLHPGKVYLTLALLAGAALIYVLALLKKKSSQAG